tara:strand:+ start:3882 stop:5717 length:1836 start_codon:yes stop_codon:yes gene_type:complete
MTLHQSIRDALPIRLGNRRYNIDVSRLARATVDPIRQGLDTQGTPGEQSLNQAGVWKRSRDDWELGGGQRESDTPESGLRRFYQSTGVNVWVKNELTLLKDTDRAWSDGSTNLYMATAKSGGTSYAYMCDGPNIQASSNSFGSATAITNPCGDDILGIASDGTNVYVVGHTAANAKIVKVTGTTFATSSDGTDHWMLNSADGVWVANGYLIASVADRLTVLSSGSVASTNADIASSSFNQVDSWVSVVGSPVGIFAAGNQGVQGRIYYIGINDSTSALNVPVIAAELPVGETVNAITEYGGLLVIGTSKGIRLAQIQGQGYITYGPLVEISGGVNYLLPQGEFVYFNWDNYDSPFDTTTRSGLGKISLAELTDVLTPAYASDIMVASSTAAVQGIVMDQGNLLFSISGAGVYKESANYLTTGSVDEGRFRWGVTELKAPVSVELRHSSLAASEAVAITVTSDDTTTATVTSDTDATYTSGIKSISGVTGEYITPTITLTGAGSTATPTLHRWTVRAIPMPFVAEVIQLPVILTTQTQYGNRDIYQDTWDDYTYIRSLLEDRSLVTFKMGDESKTVYIAGVSYEQGSIGKWSDDNGWFEGVLTVSVVTVQGS